MSGKPLRHSLAEDLLAIFIGSLLVALGVFLFRAAGILAGGTAGVAFVLHYAAHLPLGVLFFIVNLPFYLLAWRGMGPAFTLKTFAAVVLVSVLSEALPVLLVVERVNAPFAALLGGLLLGNGLLILIRHRASLGGIGVMAVVLQERRGWRAGHVQMIADLLILGAALLVVSPLAVALSVLGSAALNLVISVNHRQGRYMGV